MKSVKELVKALENIPIHKTQIIMDIRLGNHGIVAEKVGNSYVIEDEIAEDYIITRKKLQAQKSLKKKKLEKSLR